MDTQSTLTGIRAFLSHRREVLLAFVFGSFLGERLTEESDIDVAILFKDNPDFSLLSEIMDGISEITRLEADIVVLNNASPIIKMQVLRRSQVVKKINDSVYNEFFLRTVREYDDLKMVRKKQEENILKGRRYVRA